MCPRSQNAFQICLSSLRIMPWPLLSFITDSDYFATRIVSTSLRTHEIGYTSFVCETTTLNTPKDITVVYCNKICAFDVKQGKCRACYKERPFTNVWPCIVRDSLWMKPTDALNSNFISITTLHVSGSLSAHHQEFVAVHRLWYILCSCDRLLPGVAARNM